MDLSKDTRDRIFAAADALYEQGGRESFPTVDAVRKTARVNMNDASTGMKEWRRLQTARAAPVAVQVPAPVQQAAGAALATLWQEAQTLANESLRAAQAGWEAERLEADTLNQQMADAYEAQAGELTAAQARIAELEAAAREAAGLAEARRGQLEEARAALADLQQRAATAEARAGELRVELDHAHQEARQARAERDQVRGELARVQARAEALEQAHQEQRKTMAAEAHRQAERLTALQGERDQARQAAGQAREEAARLGGQLTAQKEQVTALLARVAPTTAGAVPGADGSHAR